MLTFPATQSALLWGITLLNSSLTIALIRRFNQFSNQLSDFSDMDVGLKPGTEAPDFQAETLTGETITRSHYQGKTASFIFFSPHCSACVDKISELNALAIQAKQAGVELVLVNTDGDRAETAAFVEKHQVALPVLIAPYDSNPFASQYKVNATPSFSTVNPEGYVEASGVVEPGWEKHLF
jgi:peroxiredoxin